MPGSSENAAAYSFAARLYTCCSRRGVIGSLENTMCIVRHGGPHAEMRTRAKNSTYSLPCLICPPLFVWYDAGVRERSLAQARAKHGPLSTAAQLLIDPIQKRWPPAPLPRAGSRQSPHRTKRAEVTLDSRHRCVAGDAAAARHEKVGDRVVNAAGGGFIRSEEEGVAGAVRRRLRLRTSTESL